KPPKDRCRGHFRDNGLLRVAYERIYRRLLVADGLSV
ncbi:MAG: hypothetical protein QOJ56_417, partial [Mycobacterium sp.]|nr:hypothetical protein [Mycobacterium sp.]